MREIMDFRFWKQRSEEMARQVERNRLAKALREARERPAGRVSVLAWETKRRAGRLAKLLRRRRPPGGRRSR